MGNVIRYNDIPSYQQLCEDEDFLTCLQMKIALQQA